MKKRLFAVILAAVMTVAAACGSTPAPSNNDTKETAGAEETKAEDTKAEEVTTDPSEWPVVHVEICSFTDTLEQEKPIEDALNAYLVDINAGVQCDMIPLAIGDRATTLTLMLADSSNPIDLYGYRWYSSVANLVQNDQCISLEPYRDVYPDLWELYPEKVYKTCMVDGEQYSMPSGGCFGQNEVYVMRKDVAEEIGVMDLVDTMITVEQLEDIMAKAEAAHPELCWQGDTKVFPLMGIDNLGFDEALGVMMNLGVDQNEIVNYYASEEFKNYCEMTRRWSEAGYIVDDPLNVSSYAGSELIKNDLGGGFVFEAFSLPYSYSLMRQQVPYETVTFQLTSFTGTNSCVYNGWQISTVCANPDAAMNLLHLMYTDENVLRFFSLGLEGTTYVLKDDGTAGYPEGIDANNVGWNCAAPWFYPYECLSIPFETDYVTMYDDMKAANEDPNAKYSNAMGFIFDKTPVYDQYVACTAIVGEYREALLMGEQADVEGTIAKFNEELQENGIDNIIDEMNKQYQEFLAQ